MIAAASPQAFDVEIFDAIAYQLLLPHATDEMDGYKNNDAADLSFAVIAMSDVITDYLNNDERFDAVGDDNVTWPQNNLQSEQAFRVGFEFAVKLIACISANPLGRPNIDEVLADARAFYKEKLAEVRDEAWEAREAALTKA